MSGLPDGENRLHNPTFNGLTYLTDFSRKEAQEMMTSDDWTRAVFVREPKERVLSAFLDKVGNRQLFGKRCCDNRFKNSEVDRLYCWDRTRAMDFTYFLNRTLDCPNPHWTPQSKAIDDKWWPYMTFVGYLDSAASDAERLLRSLRREESSSSAWDEFGTTGWGKDGTSPFMTQNSYSNHTTHAHANLQKFYTKCHEAFVEKHWDMDYNHHTYHFEKTHMFDYHAGDLVDCEILRK